LSHFVFNVNTLRPSIVAQEGHEVMLALMNVAPGDRHFHDCVPASLAGVVRVDPGWCKLNPHAWFQRLNL